VKPACAVWLRRRSTMGETPMKESTLRSNIIKQLSSYGGFWFVTHIDQYGTGGLPDIVGCYKGRFYGFEVKLPGKEHTLTERQARRLAQINAAGGKAAMITSVSQASDLVYSLD
jgi:hypothetical protein